MIGKTSVSSLNDDALIKKGSNSQIKYEVEEHRRQIVEYGGLGIHLGFKKSFVLFLVFFLAFVCYNKTLMQAWVQYCQQRSDTHSVFRQFKL